MSLISNSLEYPFNKGGLRGVGARGPVTSNTETVPAGFATLHPPCRWIPAPRFHEDKLRGTDRRECSNSSLPGSGVSPDPPNLPPRMGDQRGLTRRVWSQFRIEAR